MNSLSIVTDLSPIDNALKAGKIGKGTYRHYTAAILLLIASNVNPLDYEALVTYANTLPHSGKASLKAALVIMSKHYVNIAKTSDTNFETIQKFIWAIEAMNEAIQIKNPHTKRKAHWLSQDQINIILETARTNSMRDYIVMSILLGAGLRREELENLTFDALDQIPHKKQMKDILNITGKGEKPRVVYISPSLARSIREWKSVCKDGRVARRMQKGGKVGKSLSAYRIFRMVRDYGAIIGISDLDPHDCRRSYGRILYENTGNIVMVQQILGHESVRTTQKYIGLNINLDIPLDAFPV